MYGGRGSKGMRGAGVAAAVAAALAVIFVSSETRAALSFPAINERVIDSYVVPRFEALAKATRKLADDLPRVCRAEPRTMRIARKDFDAAVLAWAAVEFLRFGPMSTVGRPERFAFWPDPRGIGQRQLSALIARHDPAALDPAALAKKSAAIQGLTALETLLTDDKRFRDPATMSASYGEAWALNYFLIRTRSEQYVKYLQQMAEQSPLVPVSADERLAQFKAVFGGDLPSLDAEFVRYMRSVD
jgi:predicted lipoprotein